MTRMTVITGWLTLLVIGASAWLCDCTAADWPGFRGPRGFGVSEERGLPLHWSEQENVAWKTRLPGTGCSSPIIWGDRVFVTCYSGYGADQAKTGNVANLLRHLVCLDRVSGKVLWQSATPPKMPENSWSGQLRQHGYTTSTPTTDGKRVYVYFGRTGVLAYDMSGKELWRADVGGMLNSFGSGSSPVIHGNRVIINATVESGHLIALDRTSGKEAWRAKIHGDCWCTPLVVDVPGGKTEVVLSAPATLFAFDPETGKELWQCECLKGDAPTATPVARDGIVYVSGSSPQGRVTLAVRAGGRGDVTGTHVVWRQKAGVSNCSPILAGDYLYLFSNLAMCLRADTGAVVFQERLPGLGAEYSSPVAADGKIFLFTRKGASHVLAAKDKLELLASNDLGSADGFIASPAVSHGNLFVRSGEQLYCLGK